MSRVATALVGRVPSPDCIVVLVDADDDSPRELRSAIVEAAQRPVSCVVAVREYEAWLLAGWAEGSDKTDCETVRDAKGRVSARLGRPYSEIRDQVALTASLDLAAAQAHSPSFALFVDTLRSLSR